MTNLRFLIVESNDRSFDIDLNSLIKCLPRTIRSLKWKFNGELPQYLLDDLPNYLPYLEEIDLYDFKS